MSRAIPASFAAMAVELAVRRGWDLEALLAAANISPQGFAGVERGLTDEQVRRLVRAAWRMTDDDLLGLGPQPVPRGTLRMICFGMASVPDLGQAITRFTEFSRAVPGIPPLRLEVSGDEAAVSIGTAVFDDPDHLLTTATLAITHRVIGWAVGKQVPVRRIELPYPRPADTADLELLFGEPLGFDADSATLIMPRSALAMPMPHDEESLLNYLRDAPTLVLHGAAGEETVSRRVRRAIEKGLREHDVPAAKRLAFQLEMSPPTLRRRLRDEGTSLREVRDEILCRSAIAGLERDQEPIAALSERLGFSEPSAFTRAFRRWTGRSPSSYRRGVRSTVG